MRLLHVPFTFYPDPMGGTEVYVDALNRTLRGRGVDSHIAAPGHEDASYEHGGSPIHRFAVGNPTLAEMYGDGEPMAAARFAALLDRLRPSLVHLHAHTSAVSTRLVREAHSRAIPVIFTVHTPTVTCTRGTMMRYGAAPCDGLLDRRRCAACTAHGLGLPRPAAELLGWLPPHVGNVVAARRSGPFWTALRLGALMSLKHRAVRELLTSVDRIVAVCVWIQELLRRNGVPDGKMTLSRQGLPYPLDPAQPPPLPQPSEGLGRPLRLLFLGRLDPTKGVDVAIRALRRQPDAVPVTLDIYGVAQPGGENYARRLESLAGGDPRIRFCSPVPPDRVLPLLRGYDTLLVPSTWLETGPLVVLEAFAARLPVIGSRLGGIAELVTDEVDGLLLPPGDIDAWSDAITRFAVDAELRRRLAGTIRPPRTTEQVADDMLALYREVLAGG